MKQKLVEKVCAYSTFHQALVASKLMLQSCKAPMMNCQCHWTLLIHHISATSVISCRF